MPSALYSKFQEHSASFPTPDPEAPVKMPQDYLATLRAFLLQILTLSKDHETLKEELKLYISKGYWKGFQLAEGLIALAQELLSVDEEALSCHHYVTGATLIESGNHWRDAQIPSPTNQAELGLLWMLLGVLKNDDTLAQKGLDTASWYLNFFDRAGNPFVGLFTREKEFDLFTLYSLNYLIFMTAFRLTSRAEMRTLAEKQLEGMRTFEEKVPPYYLILSRFIEEKLNQQKFQGEVDDFFSNLEDAYAGLFVDRKEDREFAITFAGANTGLGCLHFKSVHILAFGPHFSPYFTTEGFGIFRPCHTHLEGFKDINVTQEPFGIQGWTKLISSDEKASHHYENQKEGREWLFLDLQNKQLKIHFKDLQQEIGFSFYLKAEKVCVGAQEFFPSTLDQYHGIPKPIKIFRMQDMVEFTPIEGCEMQIIPLAGEKVFWGSDFLITFSILPKNPDFQINFC